MCATDTLGIGRGFLGIRGAGFGSHRHIPTPREARAESQAPIHVGFAVNEEAIEQLLYFLSTSVFSLSVSLHQLSKFIHLSRTL